VVAGRVGVALAGLLVPAALIGIIGMRRLRRFAVA
jgi:hypothetical protein